jgi:hypothetical protein
MYRGRQGLRGNRTATGRRSTALRVALIIATLGTGLAQSAMAQAEGPPCPNEQLRQESNVNPSTGQPYSTQLPACRAYELVSPGETAGIAAPIPRLQAVIGGLGRRTLVTADGSVIFESQATPAGTGAVEHGGFVDVFRSLRTSTGWTTRDLTGFGSAPGNKILDGASTDGSAVLISTTLSLVSSDLDNPENNPTLGWDLYVVREGQPPQLVTQGTLPNTNAKETNFVPGAYPANTDLSAVGFVSPNVSLERPNPPAISTTGCYIWTAIGAAFARLTNPVGPTENGIPDHLNCEYYAVTTDGRAIIKDISGDGDPGIFVSAGAESFPSFPTIRLAGEEATFDALSASNEWAFLSSSEKLTPEANVDSGTELYAVNTTPSPTTPEVVCVSCGKNGEDAMYVGQSADGARAYFRAGNEGELYSFDPADIHSSPIPVGDPGVSKPVFSANGTHVVATTSNGLEELTEGAAPVTIAGCGSPVAVANSGDRIVCEGESSGREVINEWADGESSQLSPLGTTHFYSVLGFAGPELEDVFFEARDPLVTQDLNGGTTDIYDARAGGGFPAVRESASNGLSPNPISPPISPFTPNQGTPNSQTAALPADTSTDPPARAKAKPLTKAQQLSMALRACKRDSSRPTRAACEKRAKRRYRPKHKVGHTSTGASR